MDDILDYGEDEMSDYAYLEYAGFWERVAAALIDGMIVGFSAIIIMGILFGIFFGGTLMNLDSSSSLEENPEFLIGIVALYFGYYLLVIIGNWLYAALMESSRHQATIGKMALKLQVVNMDGDRVSFGQATGRHFGKIISAMIMYVGFIMVAFTDKKQGLHDMMASSLVVKKYQ